MNTNKSSILRGIGYSFAQSVISWIVFYLVICSPLRESDFILQFMIAIWFLAIPFYFMGKKNCNALYLLFALIMGFIMAYAMLLSTYILGILFSDIDAGFAILYPVFGIPLIGTIPVVIDILLYLFKWIRKSLRKHKSI